MLLGGVNRRPGVLSDSEVAYIRGAAGQSGIRGDGRGAGDWRPVIVRSGAVPQAVGSARVSIGDTEVLASVRASVVRPDDGSSSPAQVTLSVDAAPTAMAWAHADGDACAAELAAILRVAVVSALPKGRLSIGDEHAWALHVDALVLRADGGLVDAAAAAVHCALADVSMPEVTVVRAADTGVAEVVLGEASRWDEASGAPRPRLFRADEVPLTVTLARMPDAAGGASLSAPIADPSASEEAAASDALVFGVVRGTPSTAPGSARDPSEHSAGHAAPGVEPWETLTFVRRIGASGLVDPAALSHYVSLARVLADALFTRLHV